MCVQLGVGDEPKRYYSTLPGPLRAREREAASSGRRKEEGSQGGVRHSLYQSPHLLLLQGYNRQVRHGGRMCYDFQYTCVTDCTSFVVLISEEPQKNREAL